jgi:hypothetical protein
VVERLSERPSERPLEAAETAMLEALLYLLDAHLQRLSDQLQSAERSRGLKQRRRLELELERGADLVRRLSALRG